jgi:catechol 2,3-dioxygenase-like lactoylglutathione lyase family enzyme
VPPESVGPVIPTFRSTDWEISRPFYAKLGFGVWFEWRHAVDFPVYAGVERDGIWLHISEHTGDCEPGSAIAIQYEDVDGLHAEITANGLDADPPQDQPWGDRAFNISDPDDNTITFSWPLEG